MAEERLTDEEVALVLRRASELDTSRSSTAAPVDGLPIAAVEAAAAEVGLSPAAVRQAIAELRTGALGEELHPVVCARVVPMTPAQALAATERWLTAQVMVRARDRGSEQVWRPREDVVARIQRKADWAAAVRLKGVDEVVVRAVEVEGGTLLRIAARFERGVEAAPRIRAGGGAVVGGVGAGLLGVATGFDPALVAGVLTGVPAAGVGSVFGWRSGRRSVARRRQRVTEAIDGMLDELELGRQPAARSSVERLAARARRLRGGYRL